ncbi:MAG: riboflavin biosynthesis protein RibF [Prevotella sp.]|nr:riboflavin biosynthesis protein RibF [Prevotella sp.]MCM1074515.1 riboflavin biosynthesis protein RibF [Ruminococcus sp.]
MTDNRTSKPKGYMATVGTFDGVHTGHLYLLRQLREAADRAELRPMALVIDPHPLTLVRPERVPAQLCDFEQRRRMIQREGVEPVKLVFNEQTRSETSGEFLRRLRDEMGVKSLLVGYDNRFGSDREHGFEYYKEVGKSLGITVEEARQLPGVSSSQVRRLLLAGDIEGGNRLLGYSYGFFGTVEHGAALGRELGFPTANIFPSDNRQLIPPVGVYSSVVHIDETDVFMPSMTNIGYKPTVSGKSGNITIETHIFDFDGDLYGKCVRLHFKSRLRDERRFASLEELKARLALDASIAKAQLNND